MDFGERIKQILDALSYFGGLLLFVTFFATLIWVVLVKYFEKDGSGKYND